MSKDSSSKPLADWRISSETIASRSSAVTFFLRSAISLKRLNAVFSAAPSTSKPELLERLAQGVAAGVLAEHDRVGLAARSWWRP